MDDAARDPVPQAATAGEYVALLRDVRTAFRSDLSGTRPARLGGRALAAAEHPRHDAGADDAAPGTHSRRAAGRLRYSGGRGRQVAGDTAGPRGSPRRAGSRGERRGTDPCRPVHDRRGEHPPERRLGPAATRGALAGPSLASAGAAGGARRPDGRGDRGAATSRPSHSGQLADRRLPGGAAPGHVRPLRAEPPGAPGGRRTHRAGRRLVRPGHHQPGDGVPGVRRPAGQWHRGRAVVRRVGGRSEGARHLAGGPDRQAPAADVPGGPGRGGAGGALPVRVGPVPGGGRRGRVAALGVVPVQ